MVGKVMTVIEDKVRSGILDTWVLTHALGHGMVEMDVIQRLLSRLRGRRSRQNRWGHKSKGYVAGGSIKVDESIIDEHSVEFSKHEHDMKFERIRGVGGT